MPVFLFPGQGAQFSGMGMDLFDADADGKTGVRALFDEASGILGSDIRDVLNADAETLKRTDVSQIAITVASLAAVRALAAKGVKPAACAGFSLGEYPALAVSGVLSVADTLRVVAHRGKIMQEVADKIAAEALSSASATASPAASAGMAAVLGLSPEAVDAAIRESRIEGLFAANYNGPAQTVVSGTAAALEAAEALFKAAGAKRVIRLKVAGPFHSPLMAEAGQRFSAVLEGVPFNNPVLPLFSNVTGARIATGSEAKACAVAHISGPVRWTAEEAAIAALMADAGIDGLAEVGPGKVLSGLWADSRQPGACKPYGDYLA